MAVARRSKNGRTNMEVKKSLKCMISSSLAVQINCPAKVLKWTGHRSLENVGLEALGRERDRSERLRFGRLDCSGRHGVHCEAATLN